MQYKTTEIKRNRTIQKKKRKNRITSKNINVSPKRPLIKAEIPVKRIYLKNVKHILKDILKDKRNINLHYCSSNKISLKCLIDGLYFMTRTE